MKRCVWLVLGLLLIGSLAACHEFADDTSSAPVDASCKDTDVTAKEAAPADLGCVKVTVLKSDLSGSQVVVSVRVENNSDKALALKPSQFSVVDAGKTNGLPTTCGGKGGFSGELAPKEKIESDICWYLIGATPPVTLSYSTSGKGKALVVLAGQ